MAGGSISQSDKAGLVYLVQGAPTQPLGYGCEPLAGRRSTDLTHR
jgi:hypothetical protein